MSALAYVAAALVGLWGISHALPTRRVVAGFEPLTTDNRRVLVQEWLAEAVTMWGIAILVVLVTTLGGDDRTVAAVYDVSAGLLLALAVLTALTGARTRVVWFKVCPFVLSISAGLLVLAGLSE